METTKKADKESGSGEYRRNLYEIFRQNVEVNRSHPVIIFHGKHVSYYSVLSMADSLAESMRKKLGIGKGDMVGIALPLSPQFFIAFIALQKIGAVAVPLDPGMTSFELGNVCGLIPMHTIFAADTTSMRLEKDSGIEAVILTRIQDFLPFEKSVAYTARNLGKPPRGIDPGIRRFRFRDLIYDARGEPETVNPEKDPAVALISPSRTGDLQAMVFTPYNLVSSATSIAKSMPPLKGRFRIATTLPAFLPASFQLSVILTIFMGGTLTTVLERDNYYKLFFLCSLFDSDYILTSPYDLNSLLEEGVPNLAIRSLKGVLCSSYLLTDSMRKRLEKTYGTRVVEFYGIPEMLGVTHLQSADRAKEKPGSPGSTIRGVEAKILEEKTHSPVPVGVTGELFLKGPGLSLEYMPPLPEPDIYHIDGYLDSGDLASTDENGVFFIEDRRREAMVSRGILVSSREVEKAISGVEGVSEVAVVGIKNDKGEEEIVAVVSTEKESPNLSTKIMRRCRALLSPYKVPRKIEFRKELPKSMAGKILKRQLIEEHTKQQ